MAERRELGSNLLHSDTRVFGATTGAVLIRRSPVRSEKRAESRNQENCFTLFKFEASLHLVAIVMLHCSKSTQPMIEGHGEILSQSTRELKML